MVISSFWLDIRLFSVPVSCIRPVIRQVNMLYPAGYGLSKKKTILPGRISCALCAVHPYLVYLVISNIQLIGSKNHIVIINFLVRYVLYGLEGCGKSISLAHLIHYGWQEGTVLRSATFWNGIGSGCLQGCGSGSEIDTDSMTFVDPDPDLVDLSSSVLSDLCGSHKGIFARTSGMGGGGLFACTNGTKGFLFLFFTPGLWIRIDLIRIRI
jgi:hypothetical protein